MEQRDYLQESAIEWAPPQARREMERGGGEKRRGWGRCSSRNDPVPSWPSVPAPQLHAHTSPASASSSFVSFALDSLLPIEEASSMSDIVPSFSAPFFSFRKGDCVRRRKKAKSDRFHQFWKRLRAESQKNPIFIYILIFYF